MSKLGLNLLCGLGFFGVLAIIFQGVGFFSPAWMIYSMAIDVEKLQDFSETDLSGARDMSIDIRMGLWTINACHETYYSRQCGSVSTSELSGILSSRGTSGKNAGYAKLEGDWLPLQVLAVGAAISAVSGIVVLILFARSREDNIRCNGCLTAVCWLLSAVFILTAVGKQATEQNNYDFGSDVVNQMDVGVSLEFQTPWALIVSGIGGGCAAIVTLATVMYLICRVPVPEHEETEHWDPEKPEQRMVMINKGEFGQR